MHTNDWHIVPATQPLNPQQEEPEVEMSVCFASVVLKHDRMIVFVAGLQQTR